MAFESERERELRLEYKNKLTEIISTPGDLSAVQVWDLLRFPVAIKSWLEEDIKLRINVLVDDEVVRSVFTSKLDNQQKVLPEAVRKKLGIDELIEEIIKCF